MAANITLLQPLKHIKVQSYWSTLIYDSNLQHLSQLCCLWRLLRSSTSATRHAACTQSESCENMSHFTVEN